MRFAGGAMHALRKNKRSVFDEGKLLR